MGTTGLVQSYSLNRLFSKPSHSQWQKVKSLFCLTKTATTTNRNQGLTHLLKWQYPGDCHRRGALCSARCPLPLVPTNRQQPPVPGPGRAGPGLADHEAGVPSCPPSIILDTRADPHRGGELRRGSEPGRGTPRAAGCGGAGGAARARAASPQVRWEQ